MIIWIVGSLVFRQWTLLELLENHFHGSFKLRIVSLADQCRVHIPLYIRRDSMILDFPFALQAVDRHARRCHSPSVDKLRIIVDSHEAAPRARADQGADFGLLEIPGHGVAS